MREAIVCRLKVYGLTALFFAPVAVAAFQQWTNVWLEQHRRLESGFVLPHLEPIDDDLDCAEDFRLANAFD